MTTKTTRKTTKDAAKRTPRETEPGAATQVARELEAAGVVPMLDSALIPGRLKWLTRLRDDGVFLRSELHPSHHPFVQSLDGARWLAATDGRTLALARLADDELTAEPVENLLDFKYAVTPEQREKVRASARRLVSYLTPPARPTALVNLDAFREWATGSAEPATGACPLCAGTGLDPHVEAAEAVKRLNLSYDAGDFEYWQEVWPGRLFGQLYDRARLGDVLRYVESDATRSCGVVIREPLDGEPQPALIYTEAVRVLVMPMKDDEPGTARADGHYFPTVVYIVTRRYKERDTSDEVDGSASVSVLDLALTSNQPTPAVAVPGRLTVRCDPVDEPRLAAEYGVNSVVVARSASGAWFIPRCLSARVTAIIGGEKE